MKRDHLIRTIARAARRSGHQWVLLRQGAEHEIWSLDGQQVQIPRHREVHRVTALKILIGLENTFGQRWWQQ